MRNRYTVNVFYRFTLWLIKMNRDVLGVLLKDISIRPSIDKKFTASKI